MKIININNGNFKVICKETKANNQCQWYAVDITKIKENKTRSFLTLKGIEKYLLDCGFINSLTLYPIYKTITV